ncbi:hypothetical protein JW979_10740 [bacterium]|nr:hypothetical protein [candidate division CSSED10-310 bacterium]
MILEKGEKVHLVERRLFENDLRRHFVGEVHEISGSVIRAEGYTFILDTSTNQYTRRFDKHIRIISLSDSGNIINVLPAAADLEETNYRQSEEKRLIVTDEKSFTLDVNEFGPTQ